MKVSRERFAENRARIVDAASRLFREKGFDGVGLDAVMEAAGLTHGAFYGHFASKEDLIAQACAAAFAHADESWRAAAAPRRKLARLYLAEDHCADRARGCGFAALGADVARQGGGARRALGGALEKRVDALAARLTGPPAARRRRAIATWAGLVGSLVLARAVGDAGFSREILAAGRTAFGGDGPRRRRTARSSRRQGPALRRQSFTAGSMILSTGRPPTSSSGR